MSNQESLKNRAALCGRFDFVDSKINNDTLKAAFTTQNSYLNQLTLKQDYWFLTQDLRFSDIQNINVVELHFHYPNRKGETHFNIVYNMMRVKEIQLKNYEVAKSINRLYQLDVNQKGVDILELLNIEYSSAKADLNKEEFQLFGKDIFEIMIATRRNCESNATELPEALLKILSNINSNDKYSLDLKKGISHMFNKICE